MQFLTNRIKGDLYSIISGLLYGVLGYFGVMVLREGSSIANMLFWRFLISSIILVTLFVIRERKFNMKLNKLLKILIFNSLLYGGTSYFFFYASQYIGTGLAMVIFFSYPVGVTLLAWFYEKQKITVIYYISLILIIIGMAILAKKQEIKLDIFGIAIAILSAISYAFYIFFSKKQAKILSPLLSASIICIGNSIIFFIMAITENNFTIYTNNIIWENVTCLAIISTVLPILLMLEALKYIPANRASILSVFEPIGVVIIGVLFLGETLSLLQVMGTVTILSGALLVQFEKSKV